MSATAIGRTSRGCRTSSRKPTRTGRRNSVVFELRFGRNLRPWPQKPQTTAEAADCSSAFEASALEGRSCSLLVCRGFRGARPRRSRPALLPFRRGESERHEESRDGTMRIVRMKSRLNGSAPRACLLERGAIAVQGPVGGFSDSSAASAALAPERGSLCASAVAVAGAKHSEARRERQVEPEGKMRPLVGSALDRQCTAHRRHELLTDR